MKTINLFMVLMLIGLLLTLNASEAIAEEPDGLVLWNKLGSDEEVLNSTFGPDLEFYTGGSGPEVQGDREYVPGKFGNGVTLKGSYSNMDRIHNLVLNNLGDVIDPEKGCIELWYYQTEGPIAYSHGVYRLFDGAYGFSNGIAFQAIDDLGDKPTAIHFALRFGAATWREIWYDIANIPNNEWVHLAASWDRNGIDGTSETMRLYVDGEKVAAITENDWGNTVGERVDICGGNDHNIIGKFIMDNLKVWNYAKTDFSDRFDEGPTAIDLASFSAQASADGVTLAWETATEIDNAGFNLYRAASPDGPWTQINDALIVAQGEAVSGASYSFVDTPGYGTFYYQLEDVDFYGVSTIHGPVWVELGSAFRVPWFRPTLPEF
jgi:hypothetical protein